MDSFSRRRITRGVFLAYPAIMLILTMAMAALFLLGRIERAAHSERPATEQGGTR